MTRAKPNASPATRALAEALRQLAAAGGTVSARRPPSSAMALIAWSLAGPVDKPTLVVTEGAHALERFHQDLLALRELFPEWVAPRAGGAPPVLYLPAREGAPGQDADVDLAGLRQTALLRLHDLQSAPGGWILLTCIQALMEPAPPPAAIHRSAPWVAPGVEFEPQALAAQLVEGGYEPVPEVQAKGQFTLKGGLLDVWAVNQLWPARVEFFGSTIESLRTFDPSTQRSMERPAGLRLAPARDLVADRTSVGVLAGLPDGAVVLWSDFDAAVEHAGAHVQREADAGRETSLQSLEAVLAALRARPALQDWRFEAAPANPTWPHDLEGTPLESAVVTEVLHPDAMAQQRQRRLAFLDEELQRGHTVNVFFDTDGTRQHFEGEFSRKRARLRSRVAPLSSGFRSASMALTVLAEVDIYGQKKLSARPYDPLGRAPRPSQDPGDRLADLGSLRPGDLVVHLEHGLGRYLGLTEIDFDGRPQEVITVEYDEGARLHVPVTHSHLLSRYVGVTRQRPKLHRLGGRRWEREKADAEKAIADMAASLLETQAQRDLLQGFAFPPDTSWQREFEASFPYQETPDQLRAIADLRRDMESTRPMDRLICGDAGYGKTEVAMRAAFKAVMAGKQVAVLVPTTVLAQQHFQTFSERMAPYPVRVDVLSRFTTSRHASILAGLEDGTVDIVIGTHALVQPNVRFHNLGLAIIDEEQRFGVAHKERLKHIRRLVDVLTLTATPIPRTLYMSLTGSRDMSLLQTAPRERTAIETVVTRNTDEIVRAAIVRELNREGQVFYLHNRVATIERVRDRLRNLVPEARIAVAHGQMSAGHLKAVMRDFVAGASDVLLCTTIIESGMDIPRANTILIDRADRFGIADLYQLRGRVGRSNHKAYALFLVPAHGQVEQEARQRLGALQRHAALGAGFNLAMRDLEIRGAGNLLGAQQSGHIAAVGFGLYCQLLHRTVARLKGKPLPPVIDVEVQLDFIDLSPTQADSGRSACIPPEYVAVESQRMDLYRRLAQCTDEAQTRELREELDDRFGEPPAAVALVLLVTELRIHAHRHHIQAIRTREDKLVLQRRGDYLMEKSHFPRLRALEPEARIREIMARIETADDWASTPPGDPSASRR